MPDVVLLSILSLASGVSELKCDYASFTDLPRVCDKGCQMLLHKGFFPRVLVREEAEQPRSWQCPPLLSTINGVSQLPGKDC